MNVMANWKTNLAGASLLAVSLLTALMPVLPPQYVVIVQGVIGALGLFAAKDNNVTGGTVRQ